MAKKKKKFADSDLGIVPVIDATNDDELGLVPVSDQENPYDVIPRLKGMFPSSKGQGNLVKSIADPIGAFIGGAGKGASAGYSQRAYSPEFKEIMLKSPISAFLGEAVGSFLPGSLAVKGVRALGGAAKIPSLLRSGARSGALAGALEGAAYDTGNGPSASGAGVGAIAGGTLGLGGKILSGMGRRSDIYREMFGERLPDQALTPEKALKQATVGNGRRADFPRMVQTDINNALDNLVSEQVTPRSKALKQVLDGKSVEINPEYLRGFKRSATLGPERDKGGLDRFADIIQKRAGESGRSELTASQAQKLKQYFDSISGYAKQKPFSETASAKGDRSKAVADLLRGKLSDLDPRVSALNEPMGEALQLRQAMRAIPEGGPVGAISAPPGSDRGQLLREVDRLSGSNLSGLGSDVRAAKSLAPDYKRFAHILGFAPELYKTGRRIGGAVISPFTRIAPEQTGSALTNLILGRQNVPTQEEIDRLILELQDASNQ